MKFKLKKWYPSLPKDWDTNTIIGKNDGHPLLAPTNAKYSYCTISKTEAKETEYWSPYLFTTEDGIDIYTGDFFYVVENNELASHNEGYATGDSYKFMAIEDGRSYFTAAKYFSTKEAALKYVEEKNKPKYRVGEWIDFTESYEGLKSIGRFLKQKDNMIHLSEYYRIIDDKLRWENNNAINYTVYAQHCKKASPEIIEEVLRVVAKDKGFKEGVVFYGVEGADKNKPTEIGNPYDIEFMCLLGLYCGNSWIYSDGKWATITEGEPNRFRLNDNPIEESNEKRCIVDYDKNGQVCGFEILGDSQVVSSISVSVPGYVVDTRQNGDNQVIIEYKTD